MGRGKLPGFVIIGAMKCGTTSLHEYLSAHPQVTMSAQKELDYFIEERNFPKGLDWYRQWFPDDGTLGGESSPNYTKAHLFSGVPQRMHALLPDAKLIFIMRDPIERILSHWSHAVAMGRRTADADATFGSKRAEHNFIKTSEYDIQLDAFTPYYPLEKMLLITTEALMKDRLATLQQVFRYLGVDDSFTHESFHSIHHVSSEKVVKSDPNARRLEKPSLPPEWEDWMREHLRPHVARLREMTGLTFSEWSF